MIWIDSIENGCAVQMVCRQGWWLLVVWLDRSEPSDNNNTAKKKNKQHRTQQKSEANKIGYRRARPAVRSQPWADGRPGGAAGRSGAPIDSAPGGQGRVEAFRPMLERSNPLLRCLPWCHPGEERERRRRPVLTPAGPPKLPVQGVWVDAKAAPPIDAPAVTSSSMARFHRENGAGRRIHFVAEAPGPWDRSRLRES